MKLCILVNSLSGGGAERVAITLYQAYLKMGIDVLLVCLEKNNVYTLNNGSPIYLSERSGKEWGIVKIALLLPMAMRLKALIKNHGITHVQSHIYRANYVNVLAHKLGSSHRVQIANHGMPGQYLQAGLSGKLNIALMRWLYPGAHELICPSPAMADNFASMGVSTARVRVIPNPFDIALIQKLSRESEDHRSFKFYDNTRYLIVVGRLEPVKRVKDVITALSLLREEFEDLELIVLGDGAEKKQLKTLSKSLNISEKVHFLGYVSNPFSYMARSSVLVVASESEGFGNTIVEGLIASVKVVLPEKILSSGAFFEQKSSGGGVDKFPIKTFITADISSLVLAIRSSIEEEEIKVFPDFSCMDISVVAKRYLEKTS